MKTTPLPPTRLAPGSNLETDVIDVTSPLPALNGIGGGELVPARTRPPGYASTSPDEIRQALRRQGKVTAEQIESIVWFHAHGVENRIPSLAALGELIGFSEAVIGQVFKGNYPGKIDGVARAIEAYRPVRAARQLLGEESILELSPAKAIELFSNQCRSSATIGIVWGRSHVGKTRGARRYAALHPETTTLVTMPPGGGTPKFLRATAAAMKVRVGRAGVEDAVFSALTPQHLLLVDQMHRTILGRRMQTGTIDLLIEMHDQCGCGLVLIGTPTFMEAVQEEKNALFFEQLENRGVLRLQLPPQLPYSDAVKLALAYGLPKPAQADRAQLLKLLEANRLGRLTKILRLARGAAAANGQAFTWQAVWDMCATLQAWACGEGVYDDEGGAE